MHPDAQGPLDPLRHQIDTADLPWPKGETIPLTDHPLSDIAQDAHVYQDGNPYVLRTRWDLQGISRRARRVCLAAWSQVR